MRDTTYSHAGTRALFLIQHPDLPSSRVRVLNLLPELQAAGIQTDVQKYPSGLREKLRLLARLHQWPVVVLQKKTPTPFESALLQRCCNKLVYDFDDAVYCPHESTGKQTSRSRSIKFRGIASRADVVLAGNHELARHVAPSSRQRVVILPSAVEVRNIPVHEPTRTTGLPVIGWVGGTINLPHLALLRPALETLYRKHPFALHIVSGEPIDMGSTPTTFIPWSLNTQEQAIAAFDVGIMPLPPGPHAAGKCGYKALQYMAAGVPPIATDTETNRHIISHNHNGLLAASLDDFLPALTTLLTHPDLRQTWGAAARTRVQEAFSVESIGRQLANILLTATGGKPTDTTPGKEP